MLQSIPAPPLPHPGLKDTPIHPCILPAPSWLRGHPNASSYPPRLEGHPNPSLHPPSPFLAWRMLQPIPVPSHTWEGHPKSISLASQPLAGLEDTTIHPCTLPHLEVTPNPSPYPPSPLLAWRMVQSIPASLPAPSWLGGHPIPPCPPVPARYPVTRCRSHPSRHSRQQPHPAAAGSRAAPQACGEEGSERGRGSQGSGGSPWCRALPGDVAGWHGGSRDVLHVGDVHEGAVEVMELEDAGQEEEARDEGAGEELGDAELLQTQVA